MRCEPEHADARARHDLVIDAWRSSRPALFQRCMRLLGGHRADTEDVLAQVALKALSADRCVSREDLRSPAAWLGALSHNVCMDLHRERRRERTWQIHRDTGREHEPAIHLAQSPEEAYLHHEALERLRRGIATLPGRLRAPLLLRAEDQLSYKEIAERLQLSEENARKRVQEARDRLRRALDGATEGCAPRHGRPTAAGEGWVAAPRAAVLLRVRLPGGGERSSRVLLDAPPRALAAGSPERLSAYVAKHPAGWRKRIELATLLVADGRFEEACEHYRRVIALRPGVAACWIGLGRALEWQGRAGEAALAYARGVADVALPAARRHLEARIEASRGRPEAALRAFAAAAEAEPDNAAHAAAAAELNLDLDQPAEAGEALARALDASPDNAALLTLAYEVARRTGAAREANEIVERAILAGDTGPLSRIRFVLLRCRQRRAEGGEGKQLDVIARAIRRRAPALAEAHAAAAAIDLARGRWQEAERVLADYAEAHPQVATGWVQLSRGLYSIGKPRRALAAARRARSTDPDDGVIVAHLLRALSATAGAAEIAEEAAAALDRFPRRWTVVAEAALALALAGDARAPRASREAVGLAPRLPRAWLTHGEVLARAGRMEDACAALEQGLALLPEGDGHALSARAALLLCEIRRGLGEPRASEAWALRAVDDARRAASVDRARGLFWEAEARCALGDAGAAARYRAALASHLFYPERGAAIAALASLAPR
jgi:RNA polymerase sigma factor (sigma-70 family)